MEFDSLEQAILNKWGSEETIYKFLKRTFKQINKKCFKGKLSLPRLQIKPMWLSRGNLGEHNLAGGDYELAYVDCPATIGLFPIVLLDENDTQIVLAHEMIHHWEATAKDKQADSSYPKYIDEIIKKRFRDIIKERNWREGHSNRFISKSCEIADNLGVSVGYFLFRFPPDQKISNLEFEK